LLLLLLPLTLLLLHSVRVEQWRYTEWRVWSCTKLAADWSTLGLHAIELYDHRGCDTLHCNAEFDRWENANVAGTQKAVEQRLAALLRAHNAPNPRRAQLLKTTDQEGGGSPGWLPINASWRGNAERQFRMWYRGGLGQRPQPSRRRDLGRPQNVLQRSSQPNLCRLAAVRGKAIIVCTPSDSVCLR